MSDLDDLLGKHREEKLHYSRPARSSSITTRYYCIFRVGKRFKSIDQVKGFEKYMERRMQQVYEGGVKNVIIHGNKDISKLLEDKLQGVNRRSDSVLATELLLTATNGFFNLPQEQFEQWLDINKQWLEKKFGDNILYSTLHLNQTTPHLHVLICPVFENNKGQKILANKRYFGGKGMLMQWQDEYAAEMQKAFKQLNRGIKHSKAVHINVKHFWQMAAEPLNEKDIKQLTVKAKNAELVEMKLNSIQKTLDMYKNYYYKSEEEKKKLAADNKQLSQNLKHTQAESEVYKEAIEILAERYKLPQNAIIRVLEGIENNLEGGRER